MGIKSLLWIDFLLGFISGIFGILFFNFLETLLKIPKNIIVLISIVTLLYSFLALFLAQQNSFNVRHIKSLILANWLWSFVSIILLFLYFSPASLVGKLYLILQIIVVAGLAYFEGQALKRVKTKMQLVEVGHAPNQNNIIQSND